MQRNILSFILLLLLTTYGFAHVRKKMEVLPSTVTIDNQQLESTHQQKYIAQHLSQIKSFSIGQNTNNPENVIYAFVDPYCGYCNGLEAAVKSKANHSKFTFKFIPVSILGYSHKLVANKVNMNHSTHFTAQEIYNNTTIFNSAMLRGTPTCFLQNGSDQGTLSKINCGNL